MSMFGSEWGSGGLFGSSPPPGAPDFNPRFLDAKKAPPADRPSLTRSGGPPRRRVSARPAGQSASPVAKKPHLDAYPDDFTGGGPAPSLPDDPAEWDTYTDSKKRRIKRNNRAPSLIDDFDDFDDRMYARKPDRPKNTPDDGFDDDLDSGDIPGISAFSGGHHHSHDDEDSPRDGERDGDRDHTVPRIFSDYFGGDYAKQRAAHKNQRDSAKARTRRRVRNALLITLGVAAVSAAAIFCIKTFVVFKPFDLSAPFGQVDDEAVFTLIEPAVTQVMRGRRFSLSVENGTVKQDVSKTDAPKTEVPKTDAPKTDAPKTDAPKTDVSKTDAPKEEASKTDVSQADASQSNISPSDVSPSDVSGSDADDGGGFVLAEFGFSLADADAPDRQIIDITDDKGKVTETHVLVRRGSIIYNETLIKRFLDRVAEENEGVPMIESRHEISGEELTVYEGKEGYGIDYDTFVSRLFSAIKSKSTAVSVRMEDLTPPAVSAAALYADVHREVSDA
ncbi:MAG: hypothetical protein FWE86_01740, partial [Oscillospiraceae bacterium]|nr:hypothetical protein [Oscillospiraceae bacterium]